MTMKRLNLLFVLWTLFSSSHLFSAEVNWNIRREGGNIHPGLVLNMEDGEFSELLSGVFTDVRSLSYVRIGFIDGTNLPHQSGNMAFKAELKITPYNNSGGALASITETIEIQSYAGGTNVNIDAADYRMNGIHKVKVEVLNLWSINLSTMNQLSMLHFPEFIFLEVGYSAERYYELSMAVPQLGIQFLEYDSQGNIANTTTGNATTAVTNDILINWNYVAGAEAYDLEWTWVDNYHKVIGMPPVTSNLITLKEREFKNNSTRIRTAFQSYRIPQVFAKGYLIVRVRPVGRWLDSPEKEKYGEWSSNNGIVKNVVSDWPDVITITTSHEGARNWQYQAVYAEDGKKKEVVSYFDGSLRGRQTVTRMNSKNQSVAEETIYDNEGRGVIQMLPVPLDNPSIRYYPSLNLDGNQNSYSHHNFDWESTVEECSVVSADPVDDQVGAGLYYSAHGHTGDTDWQQYVPESNDYPFVQVEYTPDNTGRIRRQGGVGSVHQVGSGNETEYFYLQPSQEELNRLFGYKIGYNSRYKKNLVVDANGQVSVSYIDEQGRVVATGLAGNSPANLESLNSESSNPYHGIIANNLLNKQNSLDQDTEEDNNERFTTGRFGALNDGLRLNTQIGVATDNTEYNFYYDVTTDVYEESCDEVAGVSYPYVYDLTISLMDDCGQELFSQSYEHIVGIQAVNSTIGDQLSVAFENLFLEQGTYTLHKKLTVNEEALEYYTAHYLSDANPCLLDSSQFVYTPSECEENGCEECASALGTATDFMLRRAKDLNRIDETATVVPPATFTSQEEADLQLEYVALLDECRAPCAPVISCDVYTGMMLIDLYPGGQYGDLSNADMLSVYRIPNDLSGNWRSPVYYDEDGTPSQVEVFYNGSTYSPPLLATVDPAASNGYAQGIYEVAPTDLLSHLDFADRFKDSWATSLLPYHPEYALYSYVQEICTTEYQVPTTGTPLNWSSEYFDAVLKNEITTYELADDNVYGISFQSTNAILDIDPYFHITYPVHNQLTALGNSYTVLKNNLMSEALSDYKGSGLSMLHYAVKTVVYGNNFGINVNNTINTNISNWTDVLSYYPQDADMIWQLYKSYYLSYKAIINQYLMDLYSLDGGFFNGCIGPADFSLGILNAFQHSAYYDEVVLTAVAVLDLGGTFSFPVEGCQAAYNPKQNRIVRIDALYNSGTPDAAVINELSVHADYEQWRQTGLCPLTVDMERLLNALLTTGTFMSGTSMTDVDELVPDLFAAMTTSGNYPIPDPANLTDGSGMTVTGSINGSNLEIKFQEQWNNLNVSGSEVTIVIPSPVGYSWSSYGTGWQVFNVGQSYPHPSSTAVSVVLTVGNNPSNTEEVVVTYDNLNSLNLNGCQADYSNSDGRYDPKCQKEEAFEAAMLAFLQRLSLDGDLLTTITPLTGYPEYENSILSTFFGPGSGVTWTGSAGTFSSGAMTYYIGFIPPSGSVLINSFDIVGETTYFSVITSNTTNTMVNESGNHAYTIESFPSQLDFSCPCQEEQVNELQSLIEELLNELVGVSNPNNTQPQALMDMEEYLFVTNPQIVNHAITFENDCFTYGYNWGGVAKFVSPQSCISFSFCNEALNGSEAIASISNLELNETATAFTCTVTLSNQVTYTATGMLSCIQLPPCDGCFPAAELPVSCTSAYDTYKAFMETRFSGDLVPDEPGYDEAAILQNEYIGTEANFCQSAYAYIAGAYQNYIITMGITSTEDPNFLSIYEFGSTPIGYSNTKLSAAVTAYYNTLSGYPDYANPASASYLTWNEYVGQVYLSIFTICPSVKRGGYFPQPQVEFPCAQWENSVDSMNVFNQHEIYLVQMEKTFIQAYVEGAINSVIENFYEFHDNKEYHYTLYYYDRAGNLVQTVPPKGVDRFEYSYNTGSQPVVETPIVNAGGNIGATNAEINAHRQLNPYTTVNSNLAPNHTLETTYNYNSLSQLVYQKTPDGGEIRFAYDKLGRLIMSQNAKQNSANRFSYTRYDELGRVIEAGEMGLSGYWISEGGRLHSSMGESDAVNQSNFPNNLSTNRTEVTRTIYDRLPASIQVVRFQGLSPVVVSVSSLFGWYGQNYSAQTNRNRITGVLYFNSLNPSAPDDNSSYQTGSFYDYDVHGNVQQLIQVNKIAPADFRNQHFRLMRYEYDLVSGNVLKVIYQPGRQDQFMHRYSYDDDNRVTITETSKDGFVWEKDAKYFYYDHGPLARTELGEKKVQALDYAYTIQGWIKSVNGEEVSEQTMMGSDGKKTVVNSQVGRDVFGYSLSYYNGDYQAANTAMLNYTLSGDPNLGAGLYSGNIRSMHTAISDDTEAALGTHQTNYTYDQLNRIKSMTGYNRTLSVSHNLSGYKSSYSFDENGNLQTLKRHVGGSGIPMDIFEYYYNAGTNQLNWVNDLAGASLFSNVDIDNSMNADNYSYDAIGQLVKDVDEGIDNILWTVTNKVKQINYTDGRVIYFYYDGMGNRTVKEYFDGNHHHTTYYVHDAQGNVMSVYSANDDDDNIYLRERNIYGSSRLGQEQLNLEMFPISYNNEGLVINEVGDKRYELSNHLGNVLQVITDSKIGRTENIQRYYGKFDGVNDRAISATFSADLSNEVTLEAWIRTTTPPVSGSVGIASQIIYVGLQKGVHLNLFSNGRVNFDGRHGTVTSYSSGQSVTAVNDGQWHHIAGTVKIGTNTTTWKIYVDGILENSTTYAVTGSFSGLDAPFYVGARPVGYYFNGDIREVSYWNVERSATQIQQDKSTIFQGTEPNLKGYWCFSDNLNPTDDASTGNHNLSLQGAVFGSEIVPSRYYTADIKIYSDYYPYGMQMPGKHESDGDYRYGFNGYESDDEMKGTKNSYTTQFRQYDPRLGRWLTKDPVFKPQESPYALNGNNPVWFIDPNGADSAKVGGAWFWKVEKGDTYYSVGKRTGTDYQELQKINSQDAKSLKVGSLLSLSKAKTPTNSNQPTKSSSSTTPISNWVWDMLEEIPTTELSLSALAIEKLGGLEKAKKLLESGKFQVQYKGETKTWSINFNGNQYVDAEFVKSSKVRAMDINSTKTSALKVVKTGGVILNFIGIAVTAHTAYTEITTNGSISIETGADAFFGVVGFCGPVGTAVSATYFLLKPAVQWIHGAAIKSGATLDHYGNVSYEEMWELFKSGW